jgi:hypothetical protein
VRVWLPPSPVAGAGIVVGEEIIKKGVPEMVVVRPWFCRFEGARERGRVVAGMMRNGVLEMRVVENGEVGVGEGVGEIVVGWTIRRGVPLMVVVCPTAPAGAWESGIVVVDGIMIAGC